MGGEAGIGKSRLAAEARRQVEGQGWQTVQGRCFEPDRVFPYAPLIDLLRTIRDPPTHFGPLLPEVVKLLPELALILPDLKPTPRLDPEAEKRRLFETLVQFFISLIRNEPEQVPRPLLVVIEDLHWSDETSLEFLRYLARRLARQPLLLLLTYRSDELHPGLQHFLAALSREQRPVELTLSRFTRPEVDALLRAIFEQERPMRGAAYYKQAIDLLKVLDERQRLVFSLTTLIICGPAYTTDTVVPALITPAESIAWGEQAIQIARKVGLSAGEAYALALTGQILAVRGRYGHALRLMHRGFEIARYIEHRQWMCLIQRELGTLYLDLLSFSTTRQYLERSLALAKEIGSSFHIRRTMGYLISLLIVEGQFSQAETLLNTMGGLELPMQTLSQRLIWRGRVELALAQGDSALALQMVDQLFASASNLENRGIGAIPYLAKLRGEALTALRRWSEAEETLRSALATAQAWGVPRLVWRIQIALGQLYQTQEQYAKAEQSFAAARTVIDEIAATVPDTALRDNFVRQAKAMMSPPQPSTPLQAAKRAYGGLTRREREVAALVAEGKSNREIAETLVLGVRTVEGHVSNILGKLGFTSRTEIAVWAVEIGLRTGYEGRDV